MAIKYEPTGPDAKAGPMKPKTVSTVEADMKAVIKAAQAKGAKEATLWTAPVTKTRVTKPIDVTKTPVTKLEGVTKLAGRP